MQRIEVLQGSVTGVSAVTQTFPGRTLTSKPRILHVLRFRISGRNVRYESATPQIIREGDFVTVAGTPGGMAFEALAWSSHGSGTSAHQPWVLWLLVTLLFTPVAALALAGAVAVLFFDLGNARSPVVAAIVLVLATVLFGFFGIIGLLKAIRILQALRALRQAGSSA